MPNQLIHGFINLADVRDRLATEVIEVREAILITVEEHNRKINELLDLFVEPTTDYKRRFRRSIGGRLMGGDEFAVARPSKKHTTWDIAFPLQMGHDAMGMTWLARKKATVQQVNDQVARMLAADVAWVRDHVFAALFNNADWTFADPLYGDLTVKPIANGDADQYHLKTTDAYAADDHFAAQANAIADADNPFTAMAADLKEHDENAGEIVAFVPTAQKSSVQGLTEFVKVQDPRVTQGSNVTQLTGSLSFSYPGELLGYLEDSGVWVVEWPSLPSGYVIGLTTQGEKALAMRQDPEPDLQGFRPQGTIDDFPYTSDQWTRRAGFGANNRVGAYLVRIGNASYAVPTGYDSPMA